MKALNMWIMYDKANGESILLQSLSQVGFEYELLHLVKQHQHSHLVATSPSLVIKHIYKIETEYWKHLHGDLDNIYVPIQQYFTAGKWRKCGSAGRGFQKLILLVTSGMFLQSRPVLALFAWNFLLELTRAHCLNSFVAEKNFINLLQTALVVVSNRLVCLATYTIFTWILMIPKQAQFLLSSHSQQPPFKAQSASQCHILCLSNPLNIRPSNECEYFWIIQMSTGTNICT